MIYLVIYPSGKSQSFYIENVAKLYRNINGGFIVNLMETIDETTTTPALDAENA